jgi:pheromone alpha factor receptor
MSSTQPPLIDPFNQTFRLVDANGIPFNFSMSDLSDISHESVQLSILWGVQLGLSVLMFVTILLLTQPGKRTSPIFILNVLALIFNTIKSALYCVWLTSQWNNTYALISTDYSRITRMDISNSIAYPVIKFFELVVIEISLVMQVSAVLCTVSKSQRFWLVTLSVTGGVIAVGFQFALMIVNAIAISTAKAGDPPSSQLQIALAANVTLTISVGCFMIIFVSKLWYALKQRRVLGLHKFGPMQVIFIMALQTMLVPSRSSPNTRINECSS